MVPMASRTGVAGSTAYTEPASGLRSWFVAAERRFPLYVAVPVLTALFVGPLLIAVAVFNDPVPAVWAVLVLDLVALFTFAVATHSRPALFLGVLFFWFGLQRIFIAILSPHVDADSVRLLLTYKEGFTLILPAAAAGGVYLRWKMGEAALTLLVLTDALAVAWLSLLVVHFVLAGDPSTPELTYARRFAAPVLLYLGGRMLVPLAGQLTQSLNLLVAIAIAVAVFGLVERFALGVGFWATTIDAATFYEQQVRSGLLPENWTVIYRGVPDGIFIALPLEVPVRRLVSTFLEPTTLGTFLAFALILLLLVPGLGTELTANRKRLALAGVLILTLALVATLSRGGMLTVLAAGALFVGVRILQGRGSSQGLPLLLGAAVALILSAGVAITTFSSFPGDEAVRSLLETRGVSGLAAEPVSSAEPGDGAPPAPDTQQPGELEEIEVHPPGSTAEGASKHVDGLESGLDHMLGDPLGAGLGAAGNWSSSPEAGGESAVGVVAAQLGAAGLLLYLGLSISAVVSLVVVAWRCRDPLGDVALATAGALFGLLVVSFVTESAFGLLGNAPYFIFGGWVLAIALPLSRQVSFTLFPGSEVVEARSKDVPQSLDRPALGGDTIS
jgi:hypothetical protein